MKQVSAMSNMQSPQDEPAVAQLAELFIYDLQKSGELDALLKKYGL